MSDYNAIYPLVGAPTPVTRTDSAPAFPIGLEVQAVDRAAASTLGGQAGVFVYCRGSNMASAGQFVHIVNGSAVLLASANSASKYPIGVGAAALTATNVYGWVQVAGRCDFARGTNTAPSAGIPVHVCATAGIVLTNVAGGSQVQGIVGLADVTATASSAGSYCYFLDRPRMIGMMSATNAGGY
jgi:hypothetical protein